ncbi:hypothetical protein OIN59_04510 [Acidovorax sp. D2M1]|uniref:FG-GAP repeat-containing protein n=1 Tax=Acidovorax benzenivorans TaxID=2987520 RepID=A0ABT5RSL2_9BURK|nr:hypothetical protein [Acidovorax benzenivorans]MDD2176684.1 hypothetical protein [Acidovorax benzenivorans]
MPRILQPLNGLFLAIPLVLTACGGGSGSSTSPTPFSLTVGYGIKGYNFSWNASAGATRYELFEDPDGPTGSLPETQLGGALSSNSYAHSLAPQLLHERVNASYRLRACDANGCGPFTATVTPDLTQAIGKFELAGGNAARFGSYTNAIALSADGATMVVGSPSEGSSGGLAGAGAVYVFSRSTVGGTWSQQARIESTSAAAKMAFGASLALSADGNTLAVGAPEERSNARGINGDASNRDAYGAGAVYLLTRSGGTWSQQAYIKARNTPEKVETCSRLDISGTYVFPCTPQHFGFGVALSADGNLLAVGAPEEGANFAPGAAPSVGTIFTGSETIFGGGVGAVHTFARNNGAWAEQAYLPGSSADPSMTRFGAVVALSNDGTLLAANTDKDVSVLTHSGNTWSAPTQVWSKPAGLLGLHNPFALSADGTTLAVVDRSAGSDVQLRTFTRMGDAWTQQPALSVKAADQFYSNSVMLSLSADGRTLALGNLDDASNASGINGDANNQAINVAGAVNIYRRSGTSWGHSAYLKAPHPQALARFGAGVSLSGDASTLAVGTSSATDGVTPAAANAAYLY